jgi:PqqD family protein of HPr-rel-A system
MPKLTHLAVNDEGFVFDPTTGDSFHVSPTGLVILTGLRENQTDAAIAQALAKKYEVSLIDAQHDVADFRANLKNLGLL